MRKTQNIFLKALKMFEFEEFQRNTCLIYFQEEKLTKNKPNETNQN